MKFSPEYLFQFKELSTQEPLKTNGVSSVHPDMFSGDGFLLKIIASYMNKL